MTVVQAVSLTTASKARYRKCHAPKHQQAIKRFLHCGISIHEQFLGVSDIANVVGVIGRQSSVAKLFHALLTRHAVDVMAMLVASEPRNDLLTSAHSSV